MLETSGLVWGLTLGLVLVLLAVDLIVATVRPHRVGFGEATAWSLFGGPTPVSRGVIVGVLTVVTVASLLKTRRDPTVTAHAGSLRDGQDRAAGPATRTGRASGRLSPPDRRARTPAVPPPALCQGLGWAAGRESR